MEKILKNYRQNLLYISAFVILTLHYLASIQVIESRYSIFRYEIDYTGSTLKFIAGIFTIIFIKQIHSNWQSILDKFYSWYLKKSVEDEDLDYFRDPKYTNQDAVNFIESKNQESGIFSMTVRTPLKLDKYNDYSELEKKDYIKIKHSKLQNLLIGIIMLICVIMVASDVAFSKDESLVYVYLFFISVGGIGIYNIFQAFNEKTLFELNSNGIIIEDKVIPWNKVLFGYIENYNKSNSLWVKLINEDEPIRVYFDLDSLSYNRRTISHIFEYLHRKNKASNIG